MASSRDRVAWTHIFRLYKGFPHLWDKNNINYGNRSMMTDGYKILTRVYRDRLDKQASVGALRMKMKNLRTTYYRELRKIKYAKQKGEKYTPSLWYFDHLSFLGTPRPKDTAGESLQNDSTEDSTLMMQDLTQTDTTPVDDLALENSDIEFDPSPSISQSKATQRTGHQTTSNPLLEKQDYSTDVVQKKDEHWEVIGKSIGYQLRDLNKKQLTIVSKLISDAIYFGRLNKLSEVSHIEIGPYAGSPSPNTFTPSGHYSMGFHAVDVPTDQHQNARFKHEEDLIDEN